VVEVDGKRMVIVPKHWFFNDWRAWNGGASSGEMAFQQFKDGFDFVLEEARRGKPGRIDARPCGTGRAAVYGQCVREDDPLHPPARRDGLVPDPR